MKTLKFLRWLPTATILLVLLTWCCPIQAIQMKQQSVLQLSDGDLNQNILLDENEDNLINNNLDENNHNTDEEDETTIADQDWEDDSFAATTNMTEDDEIAQYLNDFDDAYDGADINSTTNETVVNDTNVGVDESAMVEPIPATIQHWVENEDEQWKPPEAPDNEQPPDVEPGPPEYPIQTDDQPKPDDEPIAQYQVIFLSDIRAARLNQTKQAKSGNTIAIESQSILSSSIEELAEPDLKDRAEIKTEEQVLQALEQDIKQSNRLSYLSIPLYLAQTSKEFKIGVLCAISLMFIVCSMFFCLVLKQKGSREATDKERMLENTILFEVVQANQSFISNTNQIN